MKFIEKINDKVKNNVITNIINDEKESNNKFSRFVKTSYDKINNFIEILDKHNIFMLSAGIAFNIFLYFIPVLLIAIYLTINLINIEVVDNTIETLMLEFLPHSDNTFIMIYEILNEITSIQKGSSTSGIIGFLSLLWISSLFISSLRSGLDRVLEIKSHRTIIFYRLKDILLTLIFPFLIIFYSFSIPAISFSVKFLSEYVPLFQAKILHDWIGQGFLFLFSLILFYLLYRFIPSEKRAPRFTIYSALIGGIMVSAARLIFSWYLVSLSNYGAFYGTYAAIISIAVWVYYFSFILLFSAEIANILSKKKME